jgi:hypothetical protein
MTKIEIENGGVEGRKAKSAARGVNARRRGRVEKKNRAGKEL